MAKKKSDDLIQAKETEDFIHYDFPDLDLKNFKEKEFKTVELHGGHYMIIGRTKKDDKLVGCRILIKRGK